VKNQTKAILKKLQKRLDSINVELDKADDFCSKLSNFISNQFTFKKPNKSQSKEALKEDSVE
jgi:hypothetical protein